MGESYAEGYLHDTWLLHLDENAEVLWSRRISAPGVQLSARALVADAEGVVLIGDTYDVATVVERGAALRIDQNGALVWSTAIMVQDCSDSSEERIWLTSAQRVANDDVLVGAAVQAYGYEGAVLRVKPDGTVTSYAAHRAQESAHLGPLVTSLVELPTSGFLAVGNYSGAQATDDWYLAGLDAAGAVQWAFTLGGHDNPANDLYDSDTYPSVTLTKDGGALLYGFTDAITPEDGGMVVKVPARSGELTLDPVALPHYAPLELAAGGTCMVSEPLTVVVSDDAVAPQEPLGVFVQDAALVPVDLAASP
ncbi:MAG: hypothetical protein IT383_17590 [Deltaproteobacteria bacterium]|nr:hypothetical protein [Deltaproteobacteria bacterium]